MKRIESFQIDHTQLKRGIYVSRKDSVGNETITTFDLRMKEPDKEPALDCAAAHTLEHIGATFLRNHNAFSEKIIYFGPMGCLTGFYLLLKGDFNSKDIVPLIQELFIFAADFEGDVPGASAVECGNHTLMDLPAAKSEAKKYYTEVLTKITRDNLIYPE
ncbi:S-ribosylhomocysteine lyase [Maridesulfovibrio hydrothermalis]|uniref:S-ribosylhomocysteine lyase n=1 Tax=Maridesulfovibrio hydrothermalis AM13 = DSM 14728 TaxID=1121451 RepID=L0RC10_9BACT|nr:S-ribosylhomocysteine lyase [Maridesulfovibrio hydrothermalis]CCO23091.1 S-ribosylhomocysteine lyase [Maridesulfovibrio hydrothermalis AM13 = DSM 14728]